MIMELYYFIEKKGTKVGPYKLSELKKQTIYFDDLIWRSDNDTWEKASTFDELSEIYIIKPPLTLKEQKLVQVNKEFTKKIIGKLIFLYVVSSFLLGVISTDIALSSWQEKSTNRYSSYFPGTDTETMYGNQEGFWFRPFKAFGSTIYLSSEEQDTGSNALLINLTLSSFVSLSFVFIAIGFIYYFTSVHYRLKKVL
jgi:hypothetical protein